MNIALSYTKHKRGEMQSSKRERDRGQYYNFN